MKYLKGYNMIEVFNHFGDSSRIWDAALSSGYPAWIIADDDCHNIDEPSQVIYGWTRISSYARTREAVLDALKKGCEYGVRNRSHQEINFLDSCIVTGNIIKVYFKSVADRITFVADNGSIRKEFKNAAHAEYTISEHDSYVRVEAETGPELIYLNPVIRCKTDPLTVTNAYPSVNLKLTICFRLFVIAINSLNIFALLCLSARFRRITGLSKIHVPVHSKRMIPGLRFRHVISSGK